MVGAEESWRIKAGTASRDPTRVRERTSASTAIGSITIQIDHNVYGKPGALFSVNRFCETHVPRAA